MSTHTLPRATLDDLMRVDGKAELVRGQIVAFPPRGYLPAHVAVNLLRSLEECGASGEVVAACTGYAFDPPLSSGRQSICPDASFYTGPLPTNRMKFITGAPTFAVEVRGQNDYGPKPDREYADKRDDYFEAGTVVVWDVDPVAETVTCYTAAAKANPTVFRRGDTADAEPAVPG